MRRCIRKLPRPNQEQQTVERPAGTFSGVIAHPTWSHEFVCSKSACHSLQVEYILSLLTTLLSQAAPQASINTASPTMYESCDASSDEAKDRQVELSFIRPRRRVRMDTRQACMVRLRKKSREEMKLTSGRIHLNLPAIVAQFGCCTRLHSPMSLVRPQRSDLTQMYLSQAMSQHDSMFCVISALP